MTTEERNRYKTKKAELAHSLAKQAAGFENASFYEALSILEMAKGNLKREMERNRAHISPEIRDEWGTVVKSASN